MELYRKRVRERKKGESLRTTLPTKKEEIIVEQIKAFTAGCSKKCSLHPNNILNESLGESVIKIVHGDDITQINHNRR